MASRKPSAKKKRVDEFKSQLGDMDDLFAREERRRDDLADARAANLERKTCTSKKRYASRSEAQRAITACASYGQTGLHSYRCPYCNSWHLTSKPQRGE